MRLLVMWRMVPAMAFRAGRRLNHRLYTEVVRARKDAELARRLALRMDSASAVVAALGFRLLALSTTNYGLAMPTLHPDRVVRTNRPPMQCGCRRRPWFRLRTCTVGAGQLELINTRNAAGPAMVEFELTLSDWKDDAGLGIRNENGDLVAAEVVNVVGTTITVRVVAEMAAYETQTWTWSYTADESVNRGRVACDRCAGACGVTSCFCGCEGVRSTGNCETFSRKSGRLSASQPDLCGAICAANRHCSAHTAQGGRMLARWSK